MKSIVISIFLLISLVLTSQNKQGLYGFSELPQSLLLNPGEKVEYEWHLGVPFASHIQTSYGASGVTLRDIFEDNQVSFNDKIQRAVSNLSDTDFFTLNQQLEIFSAGFKTGPSYDKDTYLSFGLYQETDAIVYFPKDYAELLLEGNLNNINRVFDLSDLNLRGELISVLHFGYNKRVSKKLTYGFRGKIYSSLATISSINNGGTFVTRPGGNNFFQHQFNLDIEIQTSGLKSLINGSNSDPNDNIKEFRRNLFFGKNLGLGFDVGFTYQFSNQWSMSASLQDVGFIRHSKDIENYELKGNIIFEGINPLFSDQTENPSAEGFVDAIAEDFNNLFDLEARESKFTTLRPIKFNSSLTYDFGKENEKDCNCHNTYKPYLNSVGLQLYGIKRPLQPQVALTAFYYRRLFNILRAKITYTVDTFSSKNIGFGISGHIGNYNLYAFADNLLEYQNLANANSISLQLGLNLIFGQK